MAKNRTILVVIACLSALLLVAQASSLAPRRFPTRKPGMTREEIEKAHEEAKQQRSKTQEEHLKATFPQAWRGLLRINERQWKTVEPTIDRIQVVGWSTWAGAKGWGGEDHESFHWHRHTEGMLGPAKSPHELIEGERVADELVDLLEDEDSKDEEIRKKIDELQQVRENARKELAEIRRELASVSMTPRQEAIFLIMGYID